MAKSQRSNAKKAIRTQVRDFAASAVISTHISFTPCIQRRNQAPPDWQKEADEKRYALIASISAAAKPERPSKKGEEEEEKEQVDEEAMDVPEEKVKGGKGKKGIKVVKRTRHNKVKNNPLWVKNFHKGDSKKGRKSKRQFGN